MQRPAGFTLIELMIVVAIIAISASLAVSAYSVYIARTQFTEALTITDGMKANVLDHYHETGECPSIGGVASGLESSSASYAGRYVATADVSSAGGVCVITAMMRSTTVVLPLRGKKVVLTMAATDATSHWTCASDAAALYVPRTCQ
jgi:type IV pilus assembly protein PilA